MPTNTASNAGTKVQTVSSSLMNFVEAYRIGKQADKVMATERAAVLADITDSPVCFVCPDGAEATVTRVVQSVSTPVDVAQARSITGLTPAKLLTLCNISAEKVNAAVKLGVISADEAASLLTKVDREQIRVSLKP